MKNNFLYIHIPFCESKCKYCKFASFGNIDTRKVDLYVDHLISEIKKSKIDFNNLKSIYFGGGTPSILKSEQLKQIILEIRNKWIFSKNIEITLEINPGTVNIEKLKEIKNIGINRLSIGIQTLNNESLREIGRSNRQDILEILENINLIGFENISVDFIIGLPYVKAGEILKDIKYILKNYKNIQHISVYMLEDHYYPENWEKLSINEKDYLGEYVSIKEFLKLEGINSYEISNFSRKGFECKHNMAYWNHDNVLGFGLGAHSFYKNTRFANSNKFSEYYLGKLAHKEELNKKDLFIESLMFRLRTIGLQSCSIDNLDQKKIEEFISDGFLEEKNKYIKITDKGILVIDYILKSII